MKNVENLLPNRNYVEKFINEELRQDDNTSYLRNKSGKISASTFKMRKYVVENVSVVTLSNWVRKTATLPGGRFYEFAQNLPGQKKQLENLQIFRCKLQKELGFDNKRLELCLPDRYSDQIVKPRMRVIMKKGCSSDVSMVDLIEESARRFALEDKLHTVERLVSQLKNDIAEYQLFREAQGYIPLLVHKRGADAILLEGEKFVSLDIKTSRWAKFFHDKIDAKTVARLLYENQGIDRYSENPRLYLVLPSINGQKPVTDNRSTVDQLSYSFDLCFNKEKQKKKPPIHVNVVGVRVVFLDI